MLNDAHLQSNYFQKTQVDKINDLNTTPKKQMWWLGFGRNKGYEHKKYNLSTQFDDFVNRAPRLDDSVKEIVAAGSTRMKDIVKLVETDIDSEDLSSNKKDVTKQKYLQDVTKVIIFQRHV